MIATSISALNTALALTRGRGARETEARHERCHASFARGVVVGLGVVVGRRSGSGFRLRRAGPVSGSRYRDSLGWRLYDNAAAAADRCVGWDKLPTPLGLAVLEGLRNILRQENLYDTSGEPA